MNMEPLLGVGKLLLTMLICGGVLAFSEKRILALLALIGCLLYFF